METCLAETGIGFYAIVGITLMAVAVTIGVLNYRQHKNLRLAGYGVFAFALIFAAAPAPSFAASSCDPVAAVAAALPDHSTGVQGAVQTYNVLDNDTPTPGATFVAASLRLAPAPGYVLGTSVSEDEKTVTAPTEGVYQANNNGTITYTPEADFVGSAVGVAYSIEDTAGKTVSSLYVPSVSAGMNPGVCEEEPANPIDLGTIRRAMNIGDLRRLANPSPDQVQHAVMSSSGQYILTVGTNLLDSDWSLFYSGDYGVSWTDLGQRDGYNQPYELSISDDGMQMSLLVIDDQYNGSHYLHSADRGLTWTSRPHSSNMDPRLASGGVTYYELKQAQGVDPGEVVVSTNAGATWSTVVVPSALERGPYDAIVSADGQTILVAGEGASYQQVIAVTTDGGISWEINVFDSNADGVYSPRSAAMSPGGQLLTYYVQTPSDVTIGYSSTDGGASWAAFGGSLAVDTYASKSLSDDGKIMTTAFDDEGRKYVISDDAGATWQRVPVGDEGDIALAHSAGSSTVVGYDDSSGRMMVSRDGGVSWSGVPLLDYLFNPMQVDLDVHMPGIQYELIDNDQGWRIFYDPAQDLIGYEVVDEELYSSAGSPEPTAPFQIVDLDCGAVVMTGQIQMNNWWYSPT